VEVGMVVAEDEVEDAMEKELLACSVKRILTKIEDSSWGRPEMEVRDIMLIKEMKRMALEENSLHTLQSRLAIQH
jgi:hypothetical protein